MRGGLSRFFRASASAAGIAFSRAISFRSRSSGGANVALDHDVGRVGQAAAVGVGVLRPGPDHVERQQARVDGVQQLLAIELIVGRERRRVDGADAVAELPRRAPRRQ